MVFLYNIFIIAYRLAVSIASFWNEKAKEWIKGRKKIWEELEQSPIKNSPVIWIHSSSAGEFEQAKPVIEKLKQAYPGYAILVTFFSSSGYKVAKKYTPAGGVFYLPDDTPSNAKRFVTAVNPALVIFVKYDFWYHHLKEVHARNIPLLLISAVFRENQLFFKWYGSLYREMLHFFTWIFVQDQTSLRLLQQHKAAHCSIGGDTRFDRVTEIAGNFTEIPFIETFIGDAKVIVAGSTWPGDESALVSLINEIPAHYKIIIAPHEIHSGHIEKITKEFPQPVLYSRAKENPALAPSGRTLVIDNVGMLSRLYRYADITYVGGGFTTDGIHNTLEAAVYGKPVIFGPNYKKYREAKELIEAGGGFSFTTAEELKTIAGNLVNDAGACKKASEASFQYIYQNKGATEAIMNFIYKKRLLTN